MLIENWYGSDAVTQMPLKKIRWLVSKVVLFWEQEKSEKTRKSIVFANIFNTCSHCPLIFSVYALHLLSLRAAGHIWSWFLHEPADGIHLLLTVTLSLDLCWPQSQMATFINFFPSTNQYVSSIIFSPFSLTQPKHTGYRLSHYCHIVTSTHELHPGFLSANKCIINVPESLLSITPYSF